MRNYLIVENYYERLKHIGNGDPNNQQKPYLDGQTKSVAMRAKGTGLALSQRNRCRYIGPRVPGGPRHGGGAGAFILVRCSLF